MNEADREAVVAIQRSRSVMTITLNRPQVHNALNPQLTADLTTTFHDLHGRDDVRVVVLTGSGRSFCAGADLAHMRAAADDDFAQNLAGAEALADLMLAVDRCPKPVIARVNGSAFGGGVGLISCCDIVVAVERATFAFSEVRLGLVPSVIAPFVINKIGAGQTRELFLTAERFDAAAAHRIGLVHHIAAADTLDDVVAERVDHLLQGAPGAQAAAKEIVRDLQKMPAEAQRAYTAERIARCRASAEGREGMNAFLEKRPPRWQESQDADERGGR